MTIRCYGEKGSIYLKRYQCCCFSRLKHYIWVLYENIWAFKQVRHEVTRRGGKNWITTKPIVMRYPGCDEYKSHIINKINWLTAPHSNPKPEIWYSNKKVRIKTLIYWNKSKLFYLGTSRNSAVVVGRKFNRH